MHISQPSQPYTLALSTKPSTHPSTPLYKPSRFTSHTRTMATNGANGSGRLDPHFTQHVIDTMGPKTAPRNRQVLGALVRHLHDFAREIELTHEEWMAGVHFVNAIGQISTKTRNESLRMSDILGLES